MATTQKSCDLRPFVVFVCLLSLPRYHENYEPLKAKFEEYTMVKEAGTTVELVGRLSSGWPMAVVLTDAGILERRNSAILNRVLAYVLDGGVAVFCLDVGRFVNPTDWERVFNCRLNLPWERHGEHSRAVRLSHNVAHIDEMSLPASYYQTAIFLKNVSPGDALYIEIAATGDDEMLDSSVAYTALGEGWIGYVGDTTGTKEDTQLVIMALCGIPLPPYLPGGEI